MGFTTERPYYWLFAFLALFGLAADQVSKYVIFAKLYPGNGERLSQVDVIPGCFSLQTVYTLDQFPDDSPFYFLQTLSGTRMPHVNRGALFGIGNGDGMGGGGMNHLFAGISILAAGFVLAYTLRPSVAKDRFMSIALGLVLAGTLGNLYDRIVFSGVRDFLHCYWESHVWPDFNIADCCLVCGAGLLLAHSFLITEKPVNTDELQSAAAAPLEATSTAQGM